eukprot:TRINITY_DN9803_c0_g1_i1.p1 TRINITY_DN9803_c0_g1~~TRINITY_DN9803_c0_g1_i1.p1  ORF type:complete len:248 (+),score=24.62 TRINITY_DN9803_c0_g1_i1:26-769(+)
MSNSWFWESLFIKLGVVFSWLPTGMRYVDLLVRSSRLIPSWKRENWLTINVGGTSFFTQKSTLIEKHSIFRILYKYEWEKNSAGSGWLIFSGRGWMKIMYGENYFKQQVYADLQWWEKVEEQWEDDKLEKEKQMVDFDNEYSQIRFKSRDLLYINRDPDMFKPILNYLRTGKFWFNSNFGISYLQGVEAEAKYFKVDGLLDIVRKQIKKMEQVTKENEEMRHNISKIVANQQERTTKFDTLLDKTHS